MNGLCECGCRGATTIARKTDRSKGWVKGQPLRFLRGHNGVVPRERRWQEEDRGYETPCWIWQLYTNPGGYGSAHCPTRGRMIGAHRVLYEEIHGAVPADLELDHLCRVRACVNPSHLEAVTPAENQRRGLNTQLTIDRVREIKRALRSGERPVDIAQRLGVTAVNVYNLRYGKTWADVA